jgi:hypothetical protein
MPRSGCDAEVASLDGLAGAEAAAWDAGPELDPHDAAASEARPTAKVAQTLVAISPSLLIGPSLCCFFGISGLTLRSAARPRHGAHPGPGRGLALRFARQFQG